jgi:hypothetical protein
VNNSIRHAVKFLEKEVRTYRALALFLSKNDVKMHARVGAKKVVLSPAFYKDRMKEAKKLVHELKKTN